jgi:hypothetical protein
MFESSISSSALGAGDAGELQISGDRLSLNHSFIGSASTDTGDAGNILLEVSDSLTLTEDSSVQTDADKSGGGNINVLVNYQIYLEESAIKASARGEDQDDSGGNISIDPVFIFLKDSQILAQATAGDGGAIFLVADNFISDTSSVIDASSERGNDGEVRITSPDNSVSGSIGTLISQFVEQQSILQESCVARVLKKRSSLVLEKPRRTRRLPYEYSPWSSTAVHAPDC